MVIKMSSAKSLLSEWQLRAYILYSHSYLVIILTFDRFIHYTHVLKNALART